MPYPRRPMPSGTASIAAATSRRKQAASRVAASEPTTAASRVLVAPVRGALHMTPSAAVLKRFEPLALSAVFRGRDFESRQHLWRTALKRHGKLDPYRTLSARPA